MIGNIMKFTMLFCVLILIGSLYAEDMKEVVGTISNPQIQYSFSMPESWQIKENGDILLLCKNAEECIAFLFFYADDRNKLTEKLQVVQEENNKLFQLRQDNIISKQKISIPPWFGTSWQVASQGKEEIYYALSWDPYGVSVLAIPSSLAKEAQRILKTIKFTDLPIRETHVDKKINVSPQPPILTGD